MDERVAKLVLKAVRTLPEREQNQVLTSLISSAQVEPTSLSFPPAAGGPDVVFFTDPAAFPLAPPSMGAPGQSTMLPVRLPPELHDRLRAWSAKHGFSMAGVVRGLVERFLDEQEGTSTSRTARARTSSAGGATKQRSKPRARG